MVSRKLDPDGRRVVLTDAAWEHIKERRPRPSGSVRDITAAVHEPTLRRAGHEEGEEWFWSDEPFAGLWLQVVVHYEGGEGWIATAFPRQPPRAPKR
jgi:hypothetical protein